MSEVFAAENFERVGFEGVELEVDFEAWGIGGEFFGEAWGVGDFDAIGVEHEVFDGA